MSTTTKAKAGTVKAGAGKAAAKANGKPAAGTVPAAEASAACRRAAGAVFERLTDETLELIRQAGERIGSGRADAGEIVAILGGVVAANLALAAALDGRGTAG